MSLAYGERPLSEFWSEDRRRLEQRERNRIISQHRASYAAHQIIAEAERLQDTPKEINL